MANELDLSGFDEEVQDELDLSGFDEELALEEPQQEELSEEQMEELKSNIPFASLAGTLKSAGETAGDFITGAGVGTGLSKIAAGVGGAGMEAAEELGILDPSGGVDSQLEAEGATIVPQEESLLEAYYASKDAQGRREDEAFERSPLVAGAGTLAGAIGTGSVATKALGSVGKGKKLLDALDKMKKGTAISRVAASGLEGMGAGAAVGATEGDARLLEGDVSGTLDDIAHGAKMGGTIGLGVGATGQVLKGIGKSIKSSKFGQDVADSFGLGREGVPLRSEPDYERVLQESVDTADDVRSGVQKSMKETGEIMGQLKDDVGNIDLSKQVKKTEELLKDYNAVTPKVKADKKKIQRQLSGLLDSYADPDAKAFLQKIQAEGATDEIMQEAIDDYYNSAYKNLKTVPVEEVDQIAKTFKSLTDFDGASPIKDVQLKNIAIDTSKRMGTEIKAQLGDEASDVYSKYSGLKDVESIGKIGERLDKSKMIDQVEALATKIRDAADPVDGQRAFRKMKNFLENVETSDSALYNEVLPQIKAIQKKYNVVSQVRDVPSFAQNPMKAAFGHPIAQTLRFSNYMGEVLQTPEMITKMQTRLQSMGKPYKAFIDTLEQVKNIPAGRQKSMMFGLMQQPAFRDFIKRDMDENESTKTGTEEYDTEGILEEVGALRDAKSQETENRVPELLQRLDEGRSPATETKEHEGSAGELRSTTALGTPKPNSRVEGSTDTGLYYDSEGILTTGYGHRVRDDEDPAQYMNMTPEEAETLYESDKTEHSSQLPSLLEEKGIDMESLNPEQIEALEDMLFNMGKAGLGEFNRIFEGLKTGNDELIKKSINGSTYKKQVGNRAQQNLDKLLTK